MSMNGDGQYWALAGITFLIAVAISLILRKIMTIFINRNSRFLRVNPTNFLFIKNSLSFIVFALATVWLFHKIPYLNSLGNALFASAGILAAIIGFASQKAFANIIGGIFILIFKPFAVEDTIEISGNRKGIVEEITLRHTVIRDYENRRIVVPNSVIHEEIIVNSSISDDRIRKHIDVDIAYDADVELAKEIVVRTLENHPLCIDHRTSEEVANGDPKVLIRMVSLGDFSVNLRAYVWAEDNDRAFDLQCAALTSIKKEFDEKGIEIPFPYRTLVFKNTLHSESVSTSKDS